ncbi:hypothetical protein NQZ68_016778 [Dissostichus eleginoides]|nr:hypothetical protein NQZ68_016778 [Dissostichus eleginoides]
MMKRMMRARVQINSHPPAFMMRDRELSWWKNQLNWHIQVQDKSKSLLPGFGITSRRSSVRMSMCRRSSSSTGYNTPPSMSLGFILRLGEREAAVTAELSAPEGLAGWQPKTVPVSGAWQPSRCVTTVITEDSPRPSPVRDRFPDWNPSQHANMLRSKSTSAPEMPSSISA